MGLRERYELVTNMRLLIAGLGSIGRRHFRNFLSLGVTDIILLRKNLSTLSDDELAGYPVENDIELALEKYKPDGVIVANPSSNHLEIAIPAAKAGCAILLEKPVSDTMDNVAELEQAATYNKNRILVGFQFRYHPTLRKAKEIIESGALGKILTAHSHWGEYLPNWHPWEDYKESYAARKDLGGGVIVTLTHPIDYLRYLLGDVGSVSGFNGHISPLVLRDVEDVAEIALRFSSGAIGGVHVNYFQRPPVHRLEIVGTKGTLRWDNSDGILHHYDMPDQFGVISGSPSPAITSLYPLPDGFDRNDLFIAQSKHFLNVISGQEAPICTLADGVEALKIALAAKQQK